MANQLFRYRSEICASAVEVFNWHTRPGALERLTPPWESVEIVERSGSIENGGTAVLRVKFGPISRRWNAKHTDYEEGAQFRDVQETGPFSHWDHLHRVVAESANSCVLEDLIEYRLPLGPIANLCGGRLFRKKLERMFSYRHRITKQDISRHQKYNGAPLKILVTGSSGLVGSALTPFLTTGGHEVLRLV